MGVVLTMPAGRHPPAISKTGADGDAGQRRSGEIVFLQCVRRERLEPDPQKATRH